MGTLRPEIRPRNADAAGARGAVAAQQRPSPLSSLPAQSCDPWVLFVVGCLMTLGVVMVYSASVALGGAGFEWKNIWNSPLRQSVFAAAAFVVMVAAAHVDYRLLAWERPRDFVLPGLLLLATVGALVAVLVPGVGVVQKGAARAISIPGGLTFQPSELAKLTLCVTMAALFTRPGADPRSLKRSFLPALIIGGVLIGLVGKEDLGTAALMGVVLAGLLVLGGVRWSHILGVVLLGAAGGAAKRYRLERLRTWFSETPDARDEGYQVTQSLLAIANGGWWGRGLGASIQKYDYLPQKNNDFIFSILCEELGIAGGIFVIFLFVCLLVLGWRIARRAETAFGRLLAAGITLTLCLQAAFNIGVVTNSVPTKGISLPFVSAGGSGVLFLGLAAGILAAIGRNIPAR
ncbi:MAG: cell division protein FtsW [Planctomycetes bacterium]|nr:cell division protein FtsW [Planctomycetota bacterium]